VRNLRSDSVAQPDMVFVDGDHMTLAVMDVRCSEPGLSIPDHGSVVGYYDLSPTAWVAYNLTAIRKCVNLECVNLDRQKGDYRLFGPDKSLWHCKASACPHKQPPVRARLSTLS